ncbi:cellulose biosynthesis protein BcsP [Caballeronia sp. GAWG2-1]|uniref:cellulose biosynthesis protein BcsP n=1 Tax=Caballeronia sp. GAWG2-1 TaxID=2921744 RepID=UPI0020279928|nr:cellulose biosynthesis protein BcsP [Caballeronia sp. GAWG2-1]
MNTSRDIEKLFDHFGGNAGDYQEIGRENEARNARTRWPLLATLDFAQPAIPEIAPRRDVQASPVHKREFAAQADADRATAAPTPMPINRAKPPLFARAHRRTIPPVTPPAALDSLSASRFSALADAAPVAVEAKPESAAPISDSAPAPVLARPSAPARFSASPFASEQGNAGAVTPPAILAAEASGSIKTASNSLAREGASTFRAREIPAALHPAVQTRTGPREQESNAPSILGKLFKPQEPQAPQAPEGSLTAMFDRLRQPSPSSGATDSAQPNRALFAARVTRS